MGLPDRANHAQRLCIFLMADAVQCDKKHQFAGELNDWMGLDEKHC